MLLRLLDDARPLRVRDGDYQGAAKGFEAYLAAWPDGPNAAEAHYRLAETLYVGDDQKAAAEEYARALKGWPRADWAADAAVKLASALQTQGRGGDACSVVVEFHKRYASGATAAVRARADALETKARCKAPAATKPAPNRRRST